MPRTSVAAPSHGAPSTSSRSSGEHYDCAGSVSVTCSSLPSRRIILTGLSFSAAVTVVSTSSGSSLAVTSVPLPKGASRARHAAHSKLCKALRHAPLCAQRSVVMFRS